MLYYPSPLSHGCTVFSHLSSSILDPFLMLLNDDAFYQYSLWTSIFVFHVVRWAHFSSASAPSFHSGHHSCWDSHFILHYAEKYAQILSQRKSYSYFSWAFVSFQININTFTLKAYEHFLYPGKKNNPKKEQTCGQHIVSYKCHLETCVIKCKIHSRLVITSKVYIFVV